MKNRYDFLTETWNDWLILSGVFSAQKGTIFERVFV